MLRTAPEGPVRGNRLELSCEETRGTPRVATIAFIDRIVGLSIPPRFGSKPYSRPERLASRFCLKKG